MALSTNSAQDFTRDTYSLRALDAALAGTPFAGNLHHFAEIGSTNTHAMQQGAEGAPHGSVYLADAQTAGRGRGAHSWSSPPGSGLYVSILLRPALAPGDALWLSLAAGLCVLSAVRATTGLVADLRWPNDILFERRKVAGILTEMHAEATRVRYVVIGIGINVHQPRFPDDLQKSATSLAIEGGETSRGELLLALLRALDNETTALSVGKRQGALPTGPETPLHTAQQYLITRLEAASSWIRGKQVIVDEGQSSGGAAFSGVTAGLDPRGFLQVSTDTGLRTVFSGGVREQEK